MKNIIRFNPRKYKPIKDKLWRERMMMRIIKEPSFKMCFKRDVSDKFFGTWEDLYDPDRRFRTNTIIQVSGGTGTGKSMAVISLAKKNCKNFKEQHVKFYDQEILDELKGVIEDTILIRDENPQKGVYGLGSNRIENQLEVVGDTARKFGLSLVFVEPEWKKNAIAKWYLETIDFGTVTQNGKTYRVNRIGLKEPHTLLFIGSIYLHILDEDDPDWVAYNKRKDKFIDGVLDSNFDGAKVDYENVAEDILDEMNPDIYKTKNEKKLFVLKKYPNFTSGEIQMILSAMSIIEKERVFKG